MFTNKQSIKVTAEQATKKMVIKTSRDVGGLFNALALGLGVEILAGTLDAYKDTPAYQQLLNVFSHNHPEFKPQTWDNLKLWLAHYNNSRDRELLLAPVLLQLHQQQYQPEMGKLIAEELVALVSNNKMAIQSGTPWHSLVLADKNNKPFAPNLEQLELIDRQTVLSWLQDILQKYLAAFLAALQQQFAKSEPELPFDDDGSMTQEDVKIFLEPHIGELIPDLKNKVLAQKDPHHKTYQCKDLADMAHALNIRLIENETEEVPAENKTAIHLINKNQHWDVCIDRSQGHFIDRTGGLLKVSMEQAYKGKLKASAPSMPDVQASSASCIMIKHKIIDNPGKGDCAFYAFAIGLIHIIQEEYSYGKTEMFDRWSALDPSVDIHYKAICQLDLDAPDNELLDQLQISLRGITYHTQLDELKKACANPKDEYRELVGNSTYVKFAEFYHNPATDTRFNEFANSKHMIEEIFKIDRTKVVENSEHLTLVPVFLSLVYGSDVVDPDTHVILSPVTPETHPNISSPVIAAMSSITQPAFWGTHLNLDYLARAFKVNFHPLENLKPKQIFKDVEGWHTIVINNQDHMHWTTQVPYVRELNELVLSGTTADTITEYTTQSSSKEDDQLSHDEDASEKIKQNLILLELENDEATDYSVQPSDSERRKIEFLKDAVTKATNSYLKYSQEIWFSLFHRHGNTGRVRAREFHTRFLTIEKQQNFDSIKSFLISFLANDNKNGNTYPHSFRTMLLNELYNAEARPSLQETSKHFDEMLQELAAVLEVNIGSLTHQK